VHAAGVHKHGQVASESVVPRSRQPRQQAAETRRCQVAEETHGPPSGRAQGHEVSGSHGAFTFVFRGSKFYSNLRDLTERPARPYDC
jgi:hypothetical protein